LTGSIAIWQSQKHSGDKIMKEALLLAAVHLLVGGSFGVIIVLWATQ
jgi:hypothetical protein